MYSDNVVSLCYISSQNDKTTQLCRIADYHNGGFESYTYDSTYDFRGTERDLLYGQTRDISGSVGTIAVYDWSAYQDTLTNEWRTSTHESEVSWIEIVSTFKDSPEQLVEMIKSGIKLSMSSCVASWLYVSRSLHHSVIMSKTSPRSRSNRSGNLIPIEKARNMKTASGSLLRSVGFIRFLVCYLFFLLHSKDPGIPLKYL